MSLWSESKTSYCDFPLQRFRHGPHHEVVLFSNMNEEGDAVMEIRRNKFTGENSELTEA